MLLVDKGKFSIHSLTAEEFFADSQYYLENFDEIAKSIQLNPFSEDELDFFNNHPLNSFLYIKQRNKIVAIMYSTPHRDYSCYDEFGTNNIDNWGVNYIQVHNKFKGKGFAYLLTVACFEDIKRKGGKMVDLMPNRNSAGLIHHATMDNDIGEIIVKKGVLDIDILTVVFNNKFLNSGESLLNQSETYVRHKHNPLKRNRDYYDYYFLKAYYDYDDKLENG